MTILADNKSMRINTDEMGRIKVVHPGNQIDFKYVMTDERDYIKSKKDGTVVGVISSKEFTDEFCGILREMKFGEVKVNGAKLFHPHHAIDTVLKSINVVDAVNSITNGAVIHDLTASSRNRFREYNVVLSQKDGEKPAAFSERTEVACLAFEKMGATIRDFNQETGRISAFVEAESPLGQFMIQETQRKEAAGINTFAASGVGGRH